MLQQRTPRQGRGHPLPATTRGTAHRRGRRGAPTKPRAMPPASDTATPRWPAERGSSTAKRLKPFTAKILRTMSSPLLPQPDVEAQPKLPTRSRRIAAQALSRALASKRGEVLVMTRMGYLDGQTRPSTSSRTPTILSSSTNSTPRMLRQCDSYSQTHKESDRGAAHASAFERR